MLFVHKYGGTSLADARRLDRAARRSVELARKYTFRPPVT